MEIKSIIESKYSRDNWRKLLQYIFGSKAELWETPLSVEVDKEDVREVVNLGTITLSDGKRINVYEVELADHVNIERNRVGIRNLLNSHWMGMFEGAFMICHRKDESILRFSYVSETWGFNKDGEYEKTSTATRRYTYLLGEGRGCRTAVDQFDALRQSKLTLGDVTNAFSVEALTKQFYDELFAWFLWAIKPETGITFPNNTTTADDDRDDIETKIIRLITRIMFVWFIKQKDLVPQRLFEV
ncbi:MAG: restriction endonuclease, partial [Bacteroidaceae bacterium]|nr:restriction endonuclease [Bacteroidaceae bacterium]